MLIENEKYYKVKINNINKIKKKYKRFLKYFKEIIILIIIYIGRYLYIKSLIGCNGDEFSCLHNIKFIYEGINYCIKSSLLFLIVLFLIQLKITNYYNIIIVFIIFIEFIFKDRGSSFNHHGALNLLGFFVILITGELIILIIISYIKLITNKSIRIIFFVFLFLLFFFLFIKFKDKYYCKNWDRGLNMTYIDNNSKSYPCKIIIPKNKCLIDIFGPLLDFSRFINCNNRKNKEKHLLYDISNLRNKTNNVKRIGYPITISKKPQSSTSLYDRKLFRFMKNNLIDMDNFDQLKKLSKRKRPEIILDYTKDPFGELNIQINFNKKLSNKRKLLEQNKNANNIIFIFFDNLSRVHFYRQYKRTSNFLKNFFNYEGYSTKKNKFKYHGFEFLKYHKLNKYTLYNVIPMFSGVNFKFNSSHKMVSILKDYKKKGFVTCNIQDVCHKELMRIGPLKNYIYIEFDHEYVAPSCDPNIYESGYGLFFSENGILKKCLYGKENFEYIVEYGRQFWNAYKDNKRFLRIVNTYAHEYSGEKSKYTDTILYNFLKDLYDNEQMEKTTLYIAADHGYVGLFGIYKLLNSKDWENEYSLPILIIIEYDKKNLSYEMQYNEISKNQQVLVSPFDIYYTLRYNLYGTNYKLNLNSKKSKYGESLFKSINPKDRDCSKYKIKDIHCKCK